MNINFRYLISALLLVSICTVAKAQPSYNHPTTGLQNTYTGTCMVNVCSAVYYDDGGGFANYSNNVNGVLRTFCPSNPGQAVQVYFNYFNIEGGSGCPYDFFQVINGPTQNGTVIASGCGADLQGQTYTSTHPSGCLTFRFWSDNSVNLPGWVSILTCVPHPNGFSNGPQAGTNADCAFATGICSNSYNFTGLSTGPGLTSDGCGGCVLAENHSNWYEFTINTSGTLGFTIVPNNPSVDDYDFALYQASNCSSLGSPVRCSYAATTGNTGLQTGAGDFTEDVLGNGWVETISVTAGQKFYLLINEWSPNNSGFTLNWTGTATIATPKPTFIINSTSYPDGGSFSICQNQPLTITADGAGGSTFTWWNQATGGTQIGTGATYSPSTSTPGSVTYYLQEHTASGCISARSAITINVQPTNTVSGPGSSNVCVNTAMTPINHTTTGATGIGAPSGLPPGVTASFSSGTITISGTPTSTGSFNYSIPLTGGCGSVNATGTINVTTPNTVTGPGSATVCVNTAMTPINHSTTGATGIGAPSGLPPGVTASFSSGTITISGTPTASGNFNYSIPLTGGCGSVNATGTITVNPNNTVSGPGSATVCVNTAMTNITHSTIGATGIGAPSGLPPGVTASFSSGTITISGTPTASGTYNYSIPLTGGCGSVNATGTITVNPNNTVSGPGSATVCVNTAMTPINHSTTGATGIGAPSGLPPGVTASFSSGTITISGTPTASGNFNYSIPLTGGCGSVNATGTIMVNSLPTVGINSTPGTTVCSGTSVTLSGTGASSYSWSGGITNGVAFVPSSTQTYTVTGTNANGCTNTSSVTITVNPLPTVGINTTPGTTVCSGTSVTLSGTGATSYSWSGGITNGVAFVPSGTQTYTVTGTNANGCTNTSSVTITVNPLPTVGINVSPNTTVCSGTSVTLSGTGATSYSWSGGITNGVAFVPSSTQTYTVTGTNANGCTNTSSVTISITNSNTVTGPGSSTVCIGNAMTSITHNTTGATGIGTPTGLPSGVSASFSGGIITISGTPTVVGIYNYTIPLTGGCGSVNATGTITVNSLPTIGTNSSPGTTVCSGTSVTLSGTGATSYSWSGGVSDGVSFVPSSTQTYTVTGTDVNGCTNTNSVTITVNSLPNVGYNVSPNTSVCSGTSVTLSGTGASNYSWSGGVVDGSPFVPTSTQTYTVTGTDGNGCSNTSTVTITVNTLPTVNINASPGSTICFGDPVILSATGSGTSYTWSGGISDGQPFTPTASDVYTVTASDANGCTNTTSISLVVNPLPTITAGTNSPVCIGSDIQLNASSSSGVSCAWTGPNSFNSSFCDDIISSADETLHEGNYTIVVTDINTSCTNSQTFFVDVVNTISSAIDPVSPVCQNEGVIQLTAANLGGVWSGTGTNSIGQFDPAAAGTGTHTITYTISGTCGSSSSIDISVLEAPTAIASYNGPVCENDSLIMMGNTPSYSGNYIVQWFKSNNLISNQAGDTLLNASTTLNGVYWYFIQYDNGCKDSSSVNVIITPRPAITDAIVTNASCYNSNDGSIDIQVNSSEAYNVTWSNGAATDDINNLSSGTYTVTVNVNGACTASAIYQINSPEQLDLYLKSLSQPTCGLNNGKIELSVSGGTIPYSFTWQPNVSMDSSANQLSTGQYFVSVTDANGCNDTLSVNLDCIPDSLIIPQLVTPNNDGKNDVWEVDLTNYPNNVVKIFNRWGNVVYAANPYLPSNYWDGKVGQGVMMSLGSEYLPVGTYYFVIDLFGDGSKIYKGYIELQY